MPFFRFGLIVIVSISLATGCRSSTKEEVRRNDLIPNEVPTTAPVDPWAVPEVIDVTYAQRVIKNLTRLENQIRINVFTGHEFSENTKERIRAIYQDPMVENMLTMLSEESMKDHPDIKPYPEPLIVRVGQVMTGRSDCIWFAGTVDDQAAHKLAQPLYSRVWGLKRNPKGKETYNKTGWQLVQEIPSRAEPEDPCE